MDVHRFIRPAKVQSIDLVIFQKKKKTCLLVTSASNEFVSQCFFRVVEFWEGRDNSNKFSSNLYFKKKEFFFSQINNDFISLLFLRFKTLFKIHYLFRTHVVGEGQSSVDGHVCRKGGGIGPLRDQFIL